MAKNSESDVVVNVPLGGAAYHGAYRIHMWNRQRAWIIIRTVLCAVAIAYAGIEIMKRGVQGPFALIICVASVGLLRPMIWEMWHERGLRKKKGYGKPIEYTFGDQGIHMRGPAGKALLLWSDVIKVVNHKKGFLFYQSRDGYIWIPKHLLADGDEEKLLVLAER